MELDHNSHSVFLLYYHLVMVIELRELLCSGAIRRHQLGAKDLLTPTSYDMSVKRSFDTHLIPGLPPDDFFICKAEE